MTDTEIISQTAAKIKQLNGQYLKAASSRMDSLLKLPGSMGRLEELGIKLAGIQETDRPDSSSKLSLIFAADHGVTAEGITNSPPFVTAAMVRAFCQNRTAINVLSNRAGSVLRVIDVGIASDYEVPKEVIVHKIRRGTGNIRREPAMSRSEALRAVTTGIRSTESLIAETSAKIVGIGEMGIGNTTPASALTAVFTGAAPSAVTARGAGLSSDQYKHKIQVVRDALERHQPDVSDPVGVLSALGGLEIAAMTGAMLAAAACGALVVVDGMISGAAALAAYALAPPVRERMLLSHLSAEKGSRAVADALELRPFLDLGMRLGEGTGAAAVMPLIDAAAGLLCEMGTLAEEDITMQDSP